MRRPARRGDFHFLLFFPGRILAALQRRTIMSHSQDQSDPQIQENQTADYRNSVFLPATSFPMRGDLPKKEPGILARWEAMGLGRKLRDARIGAEPFVLHDGPPYANGHLHIGHALNKILKDVINRARQMAGYDAAYVPGWDCHGLPIEWKIEEEYRKSGRNKDEVPVLQFRAECRDYARKWLDIQSAEFRRLGVEADWANRYATMDFGSEAAIAGEIGKFLLNGALYRGLRPVMWSPVEKTALAEAEIEYHDHTSTTIHVRYPVLSAHEADLIGAYVVIWTTTPWTMPGSRAVAYGPEIDYVLVEIPTGSGGTEILIVAEALLPQTLAAAGLTEHRVLRQFKGAALEGAIAAHPLRGQGYEFDIPLLPGDHVTTEQGTGLVHTAPAHGEEDFQLGRAHGIEVPETVGDDGTYYKHVPLFAGLHVYKAAEPVCAALSEAGMLLARSTLVHSYPHSWRSKAPLIYRATPQWFIRMDGPEDIRGQALAEIDRTRFIPDQGRNRIGSMVANRPDWCISRQRAWGVPIAVFVEKATGQVLRDATVMERIVSTFREEGADAWYSSPPSRFLGNDRNPEDYEQVFDVIDVWFESGSTHAFVLEARDMKWPADLYLEGSDQHRGWFQSSLLEAVGTRGSAPFEAVLTHGFVLDEQGRKMSKSLGNVTAPQEVIDQYGADILRLWVMSSDTRDDLRIGKEILKQQGELYRRLRNTLRWILGSLDGFEEAERVREADMPELERWVLHRLTELDTRFRQAVESHDWTGLYPDLHNFCATDLSAFYFDIRKDVLYCDRTDSPRRRATRTVLDHLHRCLAIWLAPVLVFTAEEAWTARFGEQDSVHLQTLPTLPHHWHDPVLARRWEEIRSIRRRVTAPIEEARRANQIGASLQAAVRLPLSLEEMDLLSEADWADITIVSALEQVYDPTRDADGASKGVLDGTQMEVSITRAPGRKCARCWKVLPEVGSIAAHPALCVRCADAVESGLICRSA
ncbi:Isoleucyl-tRNA synthetase [Granulibacter bethesdensis]|nr:Isoleucyl-tRNA synthetase [Granulibacter bethesdensis]